MNKIFLCSLSITILVVEALEILLHGELYLVVLPLWVTTMLFLIFMVVNRKRNYRYALQIANGLHELGDYNELEQKLRNGFAHFGDTLPPRGGGSPERIEYDNCFTDFSKLDLSSASIETKTLQKEILKQKKIVSVLITLVITWFLQIPVIIIMSFYKIKIIGHG